MAVRLSIGSQASSPISEAITAPNINFQFKIKNNKLDLVDQPQAMSAKMAANLLRVCHLQLKVCHLHLRHPRDTEQSHQSI